MKRQPAWLTIEAILAIHEQLIAEYGGSAGIRDRGLLESALAAPKNHFVYGQADIFDLAASYAYGITRNHPFVDGNKRTAFMAAYTFLGINKWELRAAEEDVVRAVVALSDRSMSQEEFAEWLRGASIRMTTRRKKPRR